MRREGKQARGRMANLWIRGGADPGAKSDMNVGQRVAVSRDWRRHCPHR